MIKFLRGPLAIMLLMGQAIIGAEGYTQNLLQQAQELENYSFDFSAHKLPRAYDTYGAAVQLHNQIKLIPDVKNRNGAIVLNRKILSDRKYEFDIEFKFKSEPD